jgi:hypothetical protein
VDSSRVARGLSDQGVTSVQFLLASALGLLMFLTLANLVVVQYGRGAVRSALEQGARVGAVTGSVGECEDRFDRVLGELLGGRMGEGVVPACVIGGGVVTVRAVGRFASWTPLTPDFSFDLQARATSEGPP